MKKKEYAEIVYEDESYRIANISCDEIGMLAVFLAHEVRFRADEFFTSWLEDREMIGVETNSMLVDLLDNGTIEIKDLFDEGDFDDPVFRMPKEEYRKMVEQWQKIVKQKPKEIIISWDGKEVTVEGRN